MMFEEESIEFEVESLAELKVESGTDSSETEIVSEKSQTIL